MNQTNLLRFTVLLACSLASVFVIVALSTNEWISIKYESEKVKISCGLWKVCLGGNCTVVKTVGPLVMTIFTAVLLLISSITMGALAARKSLASKPSLVLMALLFVSLILMLSTIVTFKSEIAKSLAENLEMELMDEISDVISKASDGRSLNTSRTLDAGLPARTANALRKDPTDDQELMRDLYGFSSILFISALPVTVVGLVAATYLAALHHNVWIITVKNNLHSV